MSNQNRQLQASPTQFQTLRRYPRHPGVWRSLGVRHLGKGVPVFVGASTIRIQRSGGNGR